MIREQNSKCHCGKRLSFIISPYMSPTKGVCGKCGRVYYIEDSKIDWAKINGVAANVGQQN